MEPEGVGQARGAGEGAHLGTLGSTVLSLDSIGVRYLRKDLLASSGTSWNSVLRSRLSTLETWTI